MHRLTQDLRFAWRQMARSPGFTAAAVFVLALGIGTSTAIFSVVDNILFRPLNLPDSDRLMWLCEEHPETGCAPVTPPNAADWAERSETLSAVGVARGASMRLYDDAGSRGVAAGWASPGLFEALAVGPALGRLPGEADVLPAGAGRVAVVSHSFWRSELGGDSAAVGSTLELDREPYTVIGVLPPGTEVPTLEWVRVWVPLPFAQRDEAYRGFHGVRGFGRLADGAAPADAAAELAGIYARMAAAHPEQLQGWTVRMEPVKDVIVGHVRPLLLLFLSAVVLVLLIASVNVAGFLLARATDRARELAVRSAMGADRAALVRQLATEGAVLGLLGGVAGTLAALWLTAAFVAVAPPGVPRIGEVAIDGRILTFGLVATFVSAVIFGLAPITRIQSFNLSETLKDARVGTGDRRSNRLRRALVVTELALALALVLSAGLMLRSFGTLTSWEPGFELDGLLAFQVSVPSERYPEGRQVVDIYDAIRERIRALPGVVSVGTASAGPLFGGSDGTTSFLRTDGGDMPVQDAPRARWYDAGPGYFPTLGLAIVEGRNLSEADGIGSTPTALVNQALVRRYWSDGGSPVGTRLRLPDRDTEVDVVGVVEDMRPFEPGATPEPALYISNRQWPRWATFFLLRVDGDPTALATPVRRALSAVDPEIEPVAMNTLEANLGRRLLTPRFNALLVGLFAFVALVLGATGTYGVMAYAVALRTREIGIRMALGAAAREVLRSVLLDGLRLAAWGLALGLLVALAFTRLLQGVIVGVSAFDPVTVVGTVAILTLTALVAVFVPALRAARIDPVDAIRSE